MRHRRPWSTARLLVVAIITQAIVLCCTPSAFAVVDPEMELARAGQKVQDTIFQLDDTIAQLEQAIMQLENADTLLDLCGQCADLAEMEIQRAIMKLEETVQQLTDTRAQLRVALDEINQALQALQGGVAVQDLLPEIDIINGLLQRAIDKVDRAIQKVSDATQQLNNAQMLLAACGACVQAAQMEIDRAIGLLDRAISKLDRAIQKISETISQLQAIIDREICPWDVVPNGVIDIDDVVAIILDFGCVGPNCIGDVNNSGVVDIDDVVDTILVFNLVCPGLNPPQVQVFGFDPPFGQTGDIIQIFGTGFDPNPDNNCAVVRMGPPGQQFCSLPLRVIDVQPMGPQQVMLAQVGPIWDGAQPGPIMVGTGTGEVGQVIPDPVFQLQMPEPVWVWDRDPPGGPAGDTGADFWQPIPPPPPNPWLHAEPNEGELCLLIPPNLNWLPDQKVQISLRAHNDDTGIGHDADIPCVILEGPNLGGAFDCAVRLCDAIVCSFQQLSGIQINCQPVPLPLGGAKIIVTLKAPNGQQLPIDWGNFDLCLRPPPVPVPVVIDNFSPTSGGSGTIITIQGSGFDPDPDNNCAVVMVGGTCSLPLQVIDVNPLPAPPGVIGGPTQEMRVRVGPVFPQAQAGPIMVATGQGAFDFFTPVIPEIQVTQPVWIWDRDPPDGPMDDTGTDTFDPQQPIDPVWIHGEPMNGQLCIVIPDDLQWCPDQKLDLTIRGHDHTLGLGKDGFFPCIVFEGPNTNQQECLDRICDTVMCAFFQAGLSVNCVQTPVPGGTKIEAQIFDSTTGQQLFIDWGNFDICLYPCDQPPCPWDLNGDGWVDQTDYQICIQLLGSTCMNLPPWLPCPDFNGDGVVDINDCIKIEQLIADGPRPCTPPEPVVIDNFAPTGGGAGTIIEIQGSGFDPDPDNNCAVVMVGANCSLPLQVIDVNPLPGPPGAPGGPTQVMRVQVGPVFGQAQPGPIMVARGTGAFDFFEPVFPDINVVEPVWVWDRDPPNGGMGDTGMNNFDPTQPIDPVWLHGEPQNGNLCLILPPDLEWCPDQKFNLTIRGHDHSLGLGKDGFFPCIQFMGPNTDPFQCALRICDTVQCAFLQSGLDIQCVVTMQADGSIKIQVLLFDVITGAQLNIDWGNFDLCLIPCDGQPCPWDLNGDGWVDQTDLAICFSFLGANCANLPTWVNCPDFNGDGVVDPSDCQKIEMLIGMGPFPCNPPG